MGEGNLTREPSSRGKVSTLGRYIREGCRRRSDLVMFTTSAMLLHINPFVLSLRLPSSRETEDIYRDLMLTTTGRTHTILGLFL